MSRDGVPCLIVSPLDLHTPERFWAVRQEIAANALGPSEILGSDPPRFVCITVSGTTYLFSQNHAYVVVPKKSTLTTRITAFLLSLYGCARYVIKHDIGK